MSPGKVVLSLEKLEITRFKKDKDFSNTCLFGANYFQPPNNLLVSLWFPGFYQSRQAGLRDDDHNKIFVDL